jgi:hypothetical protein
MSFLRFDNSLWAQKSYYACCCFVGSCWHLDRLVRVGSVGSFTILKCKGKHNTFFLLSGFAPVHRFVG